MLRITKGRELLLMAAVAFMATSAILVGCYKTPDESDLSTALAGNDHAGGETRAVESATDVPSPTPPATEQVDCDDEGGAERETRALWSRVGVSRSPISRQDINELVAKVDGARLNVVLFAVYTHGTAFFEPSHARFPDSGERLSNRSAFRDDEYNDALRYLLAVRDERRSDDDPLNDFEIHAWFNVHRGGDMESGWPPVDKTEPYMLHALFPEFKLKYGAYYLRKDERFVRHSTSVIHQPRFRAYMVDLIAGLVEDYGVDGVHLDHIRTGGICFNDEPLDYPGTEYDYPGCQQAYRAWTQEVYGREYTLWKDTDGHKQIRDGGSGRVAAWQERAVGMLVRDIHDEVKSVTPGAIISVAAVSNPIAPRSRRASIQGQVAWEWLDQGWIDASFVTVYSADTQGVVDKIRAVRQAVQSECRRSSVFPGLAVYDLDSKEERASLVVEQVNAVMRGQWTGQPLEPPARGVALFRATRFGEAAISGLADAPFIEAAQPFWGETVPNSAAPNSPGNQ